MLEPGDTAPDFTLPDQHGEEVSLADLRGRNVVVYFYPRAGTPGCTDQACSIRDRSSEYEAADAVVLGISTDSPDRLRGFDDDHDLGFTLLADEDHAVAEAYGAWVEKNMYGRRHWGVQRSTFVIDGAGTVAHVIPRASPKTHDDKVLAALAAISV